MRASEAATLKRVRLAALRDSPAFFGRPFAEEAAFEDAVWEKRVASNAAGSETAGFFAERMGAVVGLVVGVDAPDRDAVALNALWVAPEARGLGFGAALVDAVVRWTRERGRASVDLWVTEGNAAATALYHRAGFRPTGRVLPHEHMPALREHEHRLPLGR